MIGAIVIEVQGAAPVLLKPLTVRQLCTLQRQLAQRRSQDAIEVARAVGVTDIAQLTQAATAAREAAALTSTLVRWMFDLEGAEAAVRMAAMESGVDAETVFGLLSPDDMTDIALQAIGYQWDPDSSKWTSRSRLPSGRAIG